MRSGCLEKVLGSSFNSGKNMHWFLTNPVVWAAIFKSVTEGIQTKIFFITNFNITIDYSWTPE